jgi:peptidoglycan LD-endopeptidase LytH
LVGENNKSIKMIRKIKLFLLALLGIIFFGFLIPSNALSPIEKNNLTKIDPASFWYYPWGESGVHKGIDIFCDSGTLIKAPVSGFVIEKGYGNVSGNYIYILGPKWRTYYFAHADTVFIKKLSYVTKGDVIAKVGNTGNAKGKPFHLHYTIETIFPYPWLYDKKDIEGWRKMFYLNPNKYLGLKR